MTADSLYHLDPTDEPLLHLVFGNVDDSMLREIAKADYGMEADAHLKALVAIKDGDIPAPMEWEPQEVLELIRWSEPEDRTWKPGSFGVRGHWLRLFSCAVLIRAAAEPQNDGRFTGEDSTIIQLVDSAMKLGQETSLAALKFLCWRMHYQTPDDWDRPYLAVAILLLSVSLSLCDQEMAQFLITAADSDEMAVSELFGQCLKSQTWKDITRSLLIDSTSPSKTLKEFGNELLGDSNLV